ncbi:MAG: DUF7305 domain-containing protein [Cyanobacterium sp.]
MLHKNKQSEQDSFGANFKFKLLSVLHNSSQKGSTLAMGVGLGALMIAGTTLAIATSSQNKTNVTSDEQSAQAVAAAEAGVARIQNLLAETPELAIEDWFEEDSNGNLAPLETEDIIDNIVSGSSASPESGACVRFESAASVDLSEDKTKLLEQNLNKIVGKLSNKNPWSAIGTDTEYKVSNFIPANVTDDSPFATLTIQGRRLINGQPVANTQIKVEVPVVKNTENIPDADSPLPGPVGLWIQDFQSPLNSANSRIEANVLDSSGCNKNNNTSWASFFSNSANKLQSAFNASDFTATAGNLGFPQLPNGNEYNPPTDSSQAIQLKSCPTPTNGVRVLPAADHKANQNGEYHFHLDFDSSNCSISFGTGTEPQTFHVHHRKGIKINTDNLNFTKESPDRRLIIYGNNGLIMNENKNTHLTGDRPQNYQIYVYSGQVETSGGGNATHGFIFAPNSHVKYNGNNNHFGALWAKSIEFNGGGKTGGIFQRLDASGMESLKLDLNPTVNYQVKSITNWTRENLQ